METVIHHSLPGVGCGEKDTGRATTVYDPVTVDTAVGTHRVNKTRCEVSFRLQTWGENHVSGRVGVSVLTKSPKGPQDKRQHRNDCGKKIEMIVGTPWWSGGWDSELSAKGQV